MSFIRRCSIIALLLCTIPAFGTITVKHAKQNCTATPCTVTSTTAGDFFLIHTDSANKPASAKLGTQVASLVGCELQTPGSISNICAWVIPSVTGSQTSVTCTTCGTVNAIAGIELTGVDTSYLDAFVPCFSSNTLCNQNQGETQIGLYFTPGYSNDFIFYGGNCAGSASSLTGTNITLTSAFPNGEPNGYGIVTSNAQIGIVPDSGCSHQGAYILALKASGSTQTMTANLAYQEYSAVKTSGNATITAYVANAGDLVIIVPWCLSSCTKGTLTLGAQTATCSANGVSDGNTGMMLACAVLSATAAGSATITFTPGGSPSQWQVAYFDFVLSGQTTAAFDTSAFNNCASSCSEGHNIVLPSITPTVGDLLISDIAVQSHANGFGGSWQCYEYRASGDTESCQIGTTVNELGWIQNATGTTTANALTIVNNDLYQSIIAAYKYTSTIAPATGVLCTMTTLGAGPC